jgi:DNA polymerase III subunit epsilon
MSHFFSIDLETANFQYSSICQIGLVEFRNGNEVSSRSWLIDPRDCFDAQNIAIHGITPAMVQGQPTFKQIAPDLFRLIEGAVTVCHTHFDRVALAQACDVHGIEQLQCRWLDSAKVTRRVWDQFASSGYGLKNVADFLGIKFQHHDALEDARVAGLIMQRAIEETNRQIDDWLVAVSRRGQRSPIKLQGREDGPLAGECVVLTGELSIERRVAAQMLNELGAAVDAGVTKRTTMLVVGTQDLTKLAGKTKSASHLKAENWIAKGHPIRIIGEADFEAFYRLEQQGIH